MITKELGKITSVKFGIGGYQEAMIGLELYFQGSFGGIGFSKMYWDPNLIKRMDGHTQWTEEQRSKFFDEIVRYVSDVLSQAKVDSVEKLKGIPVEVQIEGGRLKDWRVLKEVL